MTALDASVIVPTRNRPALLADTVESLLAQDFPAGRYEVIVVDDGSQPPVAVPEGVRLERHERPRGVNAGRNTGAGMARSDLLVYVDDDIEAPAGWLSALVEGAARHPDADCLGGPIELKLEAPPARTCGVCRTWDSELELEQDEGPTGDDVYGANMVVRRRALATLGGFREDKQWGGSEVEWQWRLRREAGCIVYLPEARMLHRRTALDLSLAGGVRRRFRLGYGQAELFRRDGRSLELPQRLRRVPRLLVHAARRRCEAAAIAAAYELGVGCWAIAHPLRRAERREA